MPLSPTDLTVERLARTLREILSNDNLTPRKLQIARTLRLAAEGNNENTREIIELIEALVAQKPPCESVFCACHMFAMYVSGVAVGIALSEGQVEVEKLTEMIH